MTIEWRIKNTHLVAEIPTALHRAYVFSSASTFRAEIQYISDYGWTVMTEKSDKSIIELMNWVEEELKFRASHG